MTKKLRLYDTLTREAHFMAPLDGKQFRFYCCGPTVYAQAHIGNFRTFVNVDVLYRTLKLAGLNPFYVRNITDVDDKTIARSQQEGVLLGDFTKKWTERFQADCQSLNMVPPDVEPSAVAHIQEQIDLIASLIEKGMAYQAEDASVYFNTEAYEDYGKLSRVKERELISEEPKKSGPIQSDEYEGATADFALWKAYKDEDGDNAWDSPWGKGRPGWHIECSAMSYKHLGAEFDLHAGGMDLIFPHHENEIAQSCAGGCGPFSKYWFHGAHLMVDGGKMSKSLGNLFTLEDIQAKGFTAHDLRLTLIKGHYRKPLNFTMQSLEDAPASLARLGKLEHALAGAVSEELSFDSEGNNSCDRSAGLFTPAWEALLEDLNVPKALGELFTAAGKLESQLRKGDVKDAKSEWVGLQTIVYALGLTLTAPVEKDTVEVPEAIQQLAEARWQAKQAKDWGAADRLRSELSEAGWEIKDNKEGYEVVPS